MDTEKVLQDILSATDQPIRTLKNVFLDWHDIPPIGTSLEEAYTHYKEIGDLTKFSMWTVWAEVTQIADLARTALGELKGQDDA
jgi:hypothetical protein